MTAVSLTDWQQKLAKDDKAVLVQFKNETKDAWTLEFFDVENGKPIDNKKGSHKDKVEILPPGETTTFAVKMASHRKEKKNTKEPDTGVVTGKASHQLDPNCYEVKKKASWKQKPPLVTVRVFPPGANGEEKAEKVEEHKPADHPAAPKDEEKPKKKKGRSDKGDSGKKREKSGEKSEFTPVQTAPGVETPTGTAPPVAMAPGTEQVHLQASNMVTQGIHQFEAGMFSEAQASFVQSVACLVNFSAQSYHLFQAEMTFAIRYAQAAQFLLELKRLHSHQLYKQMALISSFLAELPLQLEHAVANLRIAIQINFQVGNFGTVAHLIQVLAGLVVGSGVTLPDQSLLEDMLNTCNSQECKDSCIPLGGSADRVLCLNTLRLIQGTTYNFCPYCATTYRPHLRTVCVYCNTILQEGHTNTQ